MQKVLCVIDMQPGFSTSNGNLDEVINLVEEAVNNGDRIVLVEYNGSYGKTHESIINAIGDHGYETVRKSTDGGGHHIMGVLGIEEEYEIHACGVNYEFCVHETVLELSEYPNVEVYLHKYACNGPFRDKLYGPYAWDHLDTVYKENGVSILA